jgi:hypothetical protein
LVTNGLLAIKCFSTLRKTEKQTFFSTQAICKQINASVTGHCEPFSLLFDFRSREKLVSEIEGQHQKGEREREREREKALVAVTIVKIKISSAYTGNVLRINFMCAPNVFQFSV